MVAAGLYVFDEEGLACSSVRSIWIISFRRVIALAAHVSAVFGIPRRFYFLHPTSWFRIEIPSLQHPVTLSLSLCLVDRSAKEFIKITVIIVISFNLHLCLVTSMRALLHFVSDITQVFFGRTFFYAVIAVGTAGNWVELLSSLSFERKNLPAPCIASFLASNFFCFAESGFRSFSVSSVSGGKRILK